MQFDVLAEGGGPFAKVIVTVLVAVNTLAAADTIATQAWTTPLGTFSATG